MKRISRLVVSVLVVAAIAACGAAPRSRSPLSKTDSANASVPNNSSPENVDVYKLSVGTMDGPVMTNAYLKSTYGIDFDVLRYSEDGSTLLSNIYFLEFGIGVEKTTGACGMYVWVNEQEIKPTFQGTTNLLNTASNITCKTTDGFSTLTIQIFPQTGSTSALVLITDDNYGQPLFTMQQKFLVNQ